MRCLGSYSPRLNMQAQFNFTKCAIGTVVNGTSECELSNVSLSQNVIGEVLYTCDICSAMTYGGHNCTYRQMPRAEWCENCQVWVPMNHICPPRPHIEKPPNYEPFEEKPVHEEKKFDSNRYRKRFHRFDRYSSSYEFGRKIDFSDENDVVFYLTHLNEWINNVRCPSDYEAFKDFARNLLEQPHRRLAFSLLAQKGNFKARTLIRASLNKLTVKQFNTYEDEPQSVEFIVFGVVVYSFMMIWLGLHFRGVANRIEGKVVNAIDRAANVVKSVGDFPGELLGSFQEKAQQVWSWFLAKMEALKKMFGLEDVEWKNLFYAILAIIAVTIAEQYLRTFFTECASELFKWLACKAGIVTVEEDEVQSGGRDDERDCLPWYMRMIHANVCGGSYESFRDMFGVMPKCVSVARALEYIVSKLDYLYSIVVSTYTGRPLPRGALEQAVFSFADSVDDLDLKLKKDASEAFSSETSRLLTVLEINCVKIRNMALGKDVWRPHYANLYARKAEKMVECRNKLSLMQRSAAVRPTPVWVYISGDRGVGKSRSLRQIMTDVFAYLKRFSDIPEVKEDFDYSDLYTMNQKEEFFDGYRGQFFTQIDDLFQMTSAEERSATSALLVNMLSSTPYSLRVASPEDKSYTYFTSRCIMSTSNLSAETFSGQNVGMVEPKALSDRRDVCVKMTGPDQYTLYGGCALEDGTVNINTEVLVSIIGEAIITRHKESKAAIEPNRIPSRLRQGFTAHRLAVGSLDSVKGKEKEEEDEVQGKTKKREEDEENEMDEGGPMVNAGDLYGYSPPDSTKFLDNGKVLKSMPKFLRDYIFANHLRLALRNYSQEQMMTWIQKCENDGVEPDNVLLFKMWIRAHYSRGTRGDYIIDDYTEMYKESLDAAVMGKFMTNVEAESILLKKTTTPDWQTILCAGTLGLIALGAVALRKLLQVCLPASAYEVQSRQKEIKPVKQVLVRAQRRNAKRFAKNRTDSVQSTSTCSRMIANNYEILEVRVASSEMPLEEVKKLKPVSSSWCLFIGGKRALVPLHVIYAFGEQGEEYVRYVSLVRSLDYIVPVSMLECVEEIRGDVGIVQFPGLAHSKRCIIGLFADTLPNYGQYEQLLPEQDTTIIHVTTALGKENGVHTIPAPEGYEDFETDITFHGIENYKGMCGVAYAHKSTGKIVAIHMAGRPAQHIARGVMIFKSDLEKFKDEYQSCDALSVELVDSSLRPGIEVLGAIPQEMRSMAVYMSKETNLTISQLDYESFPVPETTDAPAHLVAHQGLSPLKVAMEGFAKQSYARSEKYPLKYTTSDDILPSTFNQNNVRLISLWEAIYGIEGYMKTLDMSSSSGYYWKRFGFTRRQLCFDELGNRRIHPRLIADVERKFKLFKEGIIVPVMFEETLKDEIRPKEKNDLCKTRLFAAGDFTSLIIQRMVLGTFVEEMMSDPSGSPIALAINPHSKQWGDLKARLDRGGNRSLGAGDFKYYDLSVKNDLLEDFVQFVRRWHPSPDLAERVIRANFSGWHILICLVFLRHWGTSSGSFITSLFNSYCNWRIHKIAFCNLHPEEDWKEIETAFVGDDSLFSTPPHLSDYNMTYLQKFFWERYSMVYTSPFKDDNMHVDWQNCTFLKRQFVRGSCGIMAPLNKGSIANMVKWCDKSAGMEEFASVCNSVLLEAFHYGEEFYGQCYNWCLAESRRLNQLWSFLDYKAMLAFRANDYM